MVIMGLGFGMGLGDWFGILARDGRCGLKMGFVGGGRVAPRNIEVGEERHKGIPV